MSESSPEPNGVTEAMIEAAREAISGSFDVIPEGEEPFVGWSSVLAERAVRAALSVDRERDRLVEAARELVESRPPLADVHGVAPSACRFCAPSWERFDAAYVKLVEALSSVSRQEGE